MIIAMALLMMATGPEAVAAPESEIVVLARKLEATRFVWKASDKSGAWKMTRCKVKQSSGDREIDALGCQAVTLCLPTLPLASRRAPPEFHACVSDRRRALIADLAARRSAAADTAL